MTVMQQNRPADMSPARQARDEAKRLSRLVAIGGALKPAVTDEVFDVENPADLSVIGHVPRCREADVDRAVRTAQGAFDAWRKTPARTRGRLIAQAADAIEARTEEIARLSCLETGNALATQARPEVGLMVDTLRFFAGLAGELKGKAVPWEANTLFYTTRDPLGVVGAIIPWNAPLFLAAVKCGPALVAGNTIVLKSAEQAPLAVLRCAEIMQEILPPGVLNVLSGYGEECGKPLAEHPLVRKVSFTGSCAVGKLIMRYCADKICPVTLELGGKSPNVILPDADLDLVVPGVILGMRFTRAGQACTAGSRILLHEGVYDAVLDRVVAELAKLRIGDPMDERTQIGTLISKEQFDRVNYYVDMARKTPGVRVICGGGRPTDPALQKGYYFAPTLLESVPTESPVSTDEIFGPVAVVSRWRDFDAMIAEANATDFGLAATIWTRDLNRAMAFADQVQAGFVQVNQYITPRANIAYGGLKQSGLGKENSLESMLDHFTSSRTVIINAGTPGVCR